MANWYDDHTRVAAFAQVLEDAGVLDPEDTKSYKKFVTQPFKYDEIYDAWSDMNYPTQDDDNWTEFMALLDEDDDDGNSEE
jgi:hypothetical protein